MRVQINKNLFGKYRVGYKCPNCEERLKSPLSEAGNKDTCPCCGACFVVPGAEELTRITNEKLQLAQRKAASTAYIHQLKTRRKQEQAATRNLALQRANEQEEQRQQAAEARALQERTAKVAHSRRFQGPKTA
jgi:membrane protein involved in colicin uptake